jgi:hypothetical protein
MIAFLIFFVIKQLDSGIKYGAHPPRPEGTGQTPTGRPLQRPRLSLVYGACVPASSALQRRALEGIRRRDPLAPNPGHTQNRPMV